MTTEKEYQVFDVLESMFLRISFVIICVTLVVSCSNSGTIKESIRMGDKDSLITSADVRLILRDKPKNVTMGRVIEPNFITCAEPSPDIAKAISSASNTAFSGAATLPEGVTPKVAAAISREQAVAMAQLTERLSTIQLLRDGLYRACEAYANGAMSSTSYAVILSRFDDSMVTLLQSELAAGAFGRSLATLTGEASGEATSSLEATSFLKENSESLTDLTDTLKESSDVESSLKQARKQNEELKHELDKVTEKVNRIQATVQAAEVRDSPQTESLKENLKTAEAKKSSLETSLEQSSKAVSLLESSHQSKKKDVRAKEKKLEDKLAASVKGAAKAAAVAAGSITPGQQKFEIAEVLHSMQEEYLNNLNADAIAVACIVAMDTPKSELTALGEYCIQKDILNAGVKMLNDIVDRKLAIQQSMMRLELKQELKAKKPETDSADLSSLRPYRDRLRNGN